MAITPDDMTKAPDETEPTISPLAIFCYTGRTIAGGARTQEGFGDVFAPERCSTLKYAN
ncbi:MAG: hypothetical protein ABJH45_06145 [Paracoccaceae bacterium]